MYEVNVFLINIFFSDVGMSKDSSNSSMLLPNLKRLETWYPAEKFFTFEKIPNLRQLSHLSIAFSDKPSSKDISDLHTIVKETPQLNSLRVEHLSKCETLNYTCTVITTAILQNKDVIVKKNYPKTLQNSK